MTERGAEVLDFRAEAFAEGGGGFVLGEHPAFVFGEEAFEGFRLEEDAVAGTAGLEIGGFDDTFVDESENEAVGDRVAERFEEIEGEGGAAVVDLMKEAEIGVEAGAFEQGAEFVHDERVSEGEESVEGIGGRVFGAAGPSEFGAVELHEELEVFAGGCALDAIESGDVGGLGGVGEGLGEGGEAGVEIGGGIGMTAVEGEGGEAVGDFGGDGGLRDGEGFGSVAEGGELSDAEVDILAAGRFEGSAILALAGEETEADAFFEKFSHGLGSHLDVAEEEDGFELVIGDIEEKFVLFFDEQAITGFAEDGALLG